MYKRFKMEFGLGLTGAIAGTAAFIYSLFLILNNSYSLAASSVLIALLLMLAAFILAFVGAGILNANRKSGGVVLIASGLLSLSSAALSFLFAWSGLLVFPLTMLSGVLAMAKRMPDGKAPFNQSYINTFDGLK